MHTDVDKEADQREDLPSVRWKGSESQDRAYAVAYA